MDLLKNFLPILIALVSFFFLYWRENRKQFQEKVFELKINAYKEIVEQFGMLYEDFFFFLDEFQEFTGTQAEWEKIERPLFVEYMKKGTNLRVLFYRYATLLPENILEKINNLTEKLLTQANTFYSLKSNEPHDYYEHLETELFEFISSCRQDLQTDALNNGVFNRINFNFYPFNINLFKKRSK